MENEESEEHQELEEEMRRLGFKKFTLEVHLKLREKLFRRRYNKEEDQDQFNQPMKQYLLVLT